MQAPYDRPALKFFVLGDSVQERFTRRSQRNSQTAQRNAVSFASREYDSLLPCTYCLLFPVPTPTNFSAFSAAVFPVRMQSEMPIPE